MGFESETFLLLWTQSWYKRGSSGKKHIYEVVSVGVGVSLQILETQLEEISPSIAFQNCKI